MDSTRNGIFRDEPSGHAQTPPIPHTGNGIRFHTEPDSEPNRIPTPVGRGMWLWFSGAVC